MEKSFWESRYEQQQTGWNIGSVSTPIKEYLDQLTDKNMRILIPGCGFGYEAMYAHHLGFTQVYVLDFVDTALRVFQENCPTFPKEHILQADFFSFEGAFDVIIEQTLFCAIDPKMREAYVQKVSQLLVEGGKLVGLLFDRSFESGPPHGGSAAEYATLFTPFFREIFIEPAYNSIPARAGSEVFIRFLK